MHSIRNYSRAWKYILLGIVLSCLLFLIGTTKHVKIIWNEDQSFEKKFISQKIDASPVKTFSKAQIMKDLSNLYRFFDEVSTKYSREIFEQLTIFITLMASLDIKVCLLEPVILYTLLSKKHQQLLSKRKFSIEKYLGSEKVLTFGIFQDEVKQLEKEEVLSTVRTFGYEPVLHQDRLPFWMWKMSKKAELFENTTSHILLKHRKWVIHIVVLYRRANYLWHSSLQLINATDTVKTDKYLFVAKDAAFEKFDLDPVIFNDSNMLLSINIPSNSEHFLFQLPMSEFLECNLSRAVHLTKFVARPHDSMFSFEDFNQRTVIAIKELKKKLNPLLMHFWIWSGTMLGWFRQCDIIPYTTDVDFGAWAEEVDDVNALKDLFLGNKDLKIIERLGMVNRALEFHLETRRLRVDLFFLYQELNGTWYGGHRSTRGYYFKYHHPSFLLCSAELLGEKVQVPCESEKCIITEYGPNWMMPVSDWWYESSIKNKGPSIYWEKSVLSEVHVKY